MVVVLYPPVNREFESWANQLNLDLLGAITVPNAFEVERWWDWANQFIAMNNFAGRVPLATKSAYPDIKNWEDWARDFSDSFNG